MGYSNTLQKLAEGLTVTYENTIFKHSGNVGNSREKQVIEYLTKVMPKRYGFHSGEVFDKNDSYSGQIDAIICDDLFSAVFTDGTGNVLAPVESTFGIISIKSKMGVKELDNAIKGIKKYDALIRTRAKENAIYLIPDKPIEGGGIIAFSEHYQRNINCIFAFDTTVSVETMAQRLVDCKCVDLVVVPGKFLMVGRYRDEFGFLNKNQEKLDVKLLKLDNSVSLFVLFLQIYLTKSHLVARDAMAIAKFILAENNLIKSDSIEAEF